MRGNKSITKRLLAALLCVAMMASYLPAMALTASAATDTRTVDPHTLDQWKSYFGMMDGSYNNVKLTTEYAGGVWTDKSVFKPTQIPGQLTNATYNGKGFSITDKGDNFLVSLSAIASNKEVVGYSTIPTDTVFVLDLSSSMRSNDASEGSAVDELVEATNKAIRDLLKLNKNNRVAVVLFAGNNSGEFNSNDGATTVILPLDTYKTTTPGVYLESVAVGWNEDYAVEVASGVTGSSGTAVGKMETARGTFTQDGIYEAMRVLLGVTDTKVQEGVQAGVDRLPIMVLMTDGEPTLANRDYNGNDARTDLGPSEIYLKFNNYDYNHRDTIAWLTQLTAAYAKREVSQHYNNDALFYTLAFGEESTRLEEALSVVNPAETSQTLNGFWDTFLSGGAVNVYTYIERVNNRNQTRYYTTSNDTAEPLTAADKVYVDKYFPAETVNDLFNAFEDIVDEIIVQSKYYPTYVEKDVNHDGYLTFVDKVGEYMDVTDVKGIVVGNRLFSGAALASKLINGGFGAVQNPNAEGKALIRSIMTRLNINQQQAETLLQNAINKGQVSYDSVTGEFSQYIGWYADAEGNFVDFWHKDMTADQKPAAATHIIKSYGFLGDTTVIPGIAAEDMMYMTVRVTTEIATGKDMITWRIPASLVPTVTYNVSVDVDSMGNITNIVGLGLDENSAENPIRLVYEVEMENQIQDWNVAEKVSPDYIAKNGYVFYTNRWTSDAEDTTKNTYSHFEPSVENERYYYTQDTDVLVKNGENYTPYTGTKPSGSGYYHAYQVFELLTDGSLRIHAHYEPISSAAMQSVKADGGKWVIPKGTIHRYYDYEITPKVSNDTGTMAHSDHPFVVKSGQAYYTYSTQGNNGLLTMTPATGIRLTKTLADGYTNDQDFTFRIAGNIADAQLIHVDAEGNEASREALAASGQFKVKADETVYIVGLTADSYTVSEIVPDGADYAVSQVKINGAAVSGYDAAVTLTQQQITDVAFTNDEKGYGNVFVTKEIVSDHVVPDAVAEQLFEVEAFVGTGLAGNTYTVAYSNASGRQEAQATVDATGYLRLEGGTNAFMRRTQTYEILGLPEGTQVQIREILSAEQEAYFTATVKTRDHTGAQQDNDNTVTVHKNANATAVITNSYAPAPVTVKLDVEGTKNFVVDAALSQDVTFDFAVQRSSGNDWLDIATKTASVTYGSADGTGTLTKTFAIENVLEGITFNTVGTYSYRVVEIIPDTRAPGVTYDRTLYTFDVTVVDEGGKLAAKVTGYKGETLSDTYEVSFTNSYNTAPVSLDVYKTVDNKANNPEATANTPFTFVVTATDSSYQPDGHTYARTVYGEGMLRFTNNFNAPGTYYATVHEQIPAGATLVTDGSYSGMYTLNGWYYDATVWYLQVVITEENGVLKSAILYGTDPASLTNGADSVELDFENVYAPETTKVDLNLVPTVCKELTGRKLEAGEFTFYVTENNNHSNILLTGTNDANGNVTFEGQLSFDAIGQYAFDVIEKQESKGGITYDKTVYDMVVEITDNGDGTLKGTYFFEDSVNNQVTFHNTYRTTGVSYGIAGTKTLNGRPLLNGEFTFRLEEATDASGTVKQDGVKLTAENGHATGNQAQFVFPQIAYTAAGTYFYKITEVAGAAGQGVTYSTDSYVYRVEIADNGAGALVVADTAIVSYNGSASGLPATVNFVNTYKAQKVQTTLPTYKELIGKVLGDGEFSFIMTQTESDFATPVAGGFTETVTNNDKGMLTFGDNGKILEFEEEGTRYFVVKEDASAAAGGITYDTSEFQVTIEAKDNHQGKLEVTTSIQKKTTVVEDGEITTVIQPVSSIIFYNRYDPDPITYAPAAKKIYEGDTMKNFDFTLSGDGFETQTKQNNAAGDVQFDALTFTEVGTYTFTIREQQNTLWGFIKWDTNVYTLTVTVEDKGLGQLEIAGTTVTSDNGRNDLVFRNVHEDLILTKDVAKAEAPTVSIDGKKVQGGDVLTYTITYKNYTGKMADVTITDTLPQYVRYVTGSASHDGVYSSGKLVWELKNIPADGEVTVSFDVQVEQTQGAVSNQAQVLEGVNTYDSNTVTTTVVEDEVKKDVFAAAQPTVSIDGQKVAVGEILLYKITYTNADDSVATVTVYDTVPAHTTYVEGSADKGGALTDGQLVWNLTVNPGQTETVTFQVKVDDADVFIDNKAKAMDGSNTYWTDVVTNHTYEEVGGKDVTLEGKPTVSIDGKQVAVGEVLVYTIDYTNITDAPVDVTITDTVPAYTALHNAGTGKVSGDTITWEFKNVQPRETVTVTFQVKVTEPGQTIENQAQIFDGTNKVTNKVVNAVPGKAVDKQVVSVGDTLTYALSYRNVTGKPAKVVIVDKLPAALAYVDGSAGESVYADGTITWTFNDVPAGKVVTVSFRATVKDTGDITNQGQIFENDVEVAFTNETVTRVEEPKLSIKKEQQVGTGKVTTDKLTVKSGDEVTYILTLTNTGKGDANHVTVKDKLPANLIFLSADNGGQLLGSTVTWELATVKSGETVVLTVKTKVPSVQKDTVWKNIAAYTYEDENVDSNEVEIELKVPVTPETGDDFNAVLFISLMILSSFGLAAVMVCKKREEAKEEA